MYVMLQTYILYAPQTDCCVQQTTLDLLERGYDVHVIVDACSTRTQVRRKFAIKVSALPTNV